MTPLQVTDPVVRHIHIVGIGGKGMSAIGAALLDIGKTVSGSDLERSPQAERLRRRGARINIGHCADYIADADMVIHSSAISPKNPELAAARAAGAPIGTRAEAVAALFNDRRGIAIAGTHGKTTTSALTATVLRGAGLAPSFLIGADVPSLGGVNGRIDTGAWMVLEADEFDDAFLSYRPRVAVLTHLEPDHLDYFGSVDRMVAAFEAFVDQLPVDAALVARRDVALLRRVVERHSREVTWFGPGGDWCIERYRPGIPGPTLDISGPRGPLVVKLPMSGRHNAFNTLAALAAASLAGVNSIEAARSIEAYQGTERRLQLRANEQGVCIFEDYAHHPTAVRASLQAVRELRPRRVIAIFQPLLQSRTRELFDDFLDAFGNADQVLLADIHSPPGREEPIDICSADLAEALIHPNAEALSSLDAIADRVLTEATDGDLILVMGPESITPLADRLTAGVSQVPTK
jgi:UDP-N-acetylmuramate--alanine ligase